MSSAVGALVLVEGESDRIAVETLATRRGRDLPAEGIRVIPIGGAQAIERALAAAVEALLREAGELARPVEQQLRAVAAP